MLGGRQEGRPRGHVERAARHRGRADEHDVTLKVADQVRLDFDRIAPSGASCPPQGDKESGS